MTHIAQKSREELPELEPIFQAVEGTMGFVPNSMLTMAHWPALLGTFSAMAGTILGEAEVERSLKQLVAFVVSNAAGCRYCQAHTSHTAERMGVSAEKLAAAFSFADSDLFSAAERAALDVALHAGMVPNDVDSQQMATLRNHFSETQIVEIVAVISLFGFLNRWNDTMATTLEAQPLSFAMNQLSDFGWQAGKHNE